MASSWIHAVFVLLQWIILVWFNQKYLVAFQMCLYLLLHVMHINFGILAISTQLAETFSRQGGYWFGLLCSQTCGLLFYKAFIPISLDTNISATTTMQICIGSDCVFLTMMNGRTLSYKCPLSVFDVTCKLPRLPAYTIYKIINDTKVLEGS